VFDPIIILFVLTFAMLEGVAALPMGPQVPSVWLAVFVVGGLVTLVALGYAINSWYLARFDRTGHPAAMLASFRLEWIAKLLLGCHWLVSMLWFDWIGTVRGFVGGDLILVDEAIATLPFLLALFALYGLPYPMQSRARESMMLRAIEQGLPVKPSIGFAGFVLEAIRHRAAIILIPVLILTGLADVIDRLFQSFHEAGHQFMKTEWAAALPAVLQACAALLVLSFLPVLLRVIWRTSPMPACPMRDRLSTMCRQQGVRVRDILVWHTSSGMLNGALIGVLPRYRYILLTDALIERLPSSQLEAVMAHEIAHARRHHLPWLLGAMVGLITVTTIGVWLIARPFILGIQDHQERAFWGDLVSGSSLGLAMVAAFFVFGYLSRKFERQADAFATQHLSGVRFKRGEPHPSDRCPIISGQAVFAMQQALGSVSASSGTPRERFTFRHGSIAERQRALQHLIGQPALALPIDRTVRRFKRLTAVLLLAAIAMSVYQVNLERRDAEDARQQILRQWYDQASSPQWWLNAMGDRSP